MEIKPCPFCEGDDVQIDNIMRADPWWVACKGMNCRCYGPNGNTREEAIKKWNAAPRRKKDNE